MVVVSSPNQPMISRRTQGRESAPRPDAYLTSHAGHRESDLDTPDRSVVLTFGTWTSNGVLVAYRINGLDWMFANVTTAGSHLLVTPGTPGSNLTDPSKPSSFELRVTNWAYGVQLEAVSLSAGEKLIKLPDYSRRIEVIGDSLASGMYTSYEGLSSWA